MSVGSVTAAREGLPQLRAAARRLDRLRGRRLETAVYDLIERRGFAIPVLLQRLPRLTPATQRGVAAAIENFLFFHPRRGVRHFDRLLACTEMAAVEARRHLVPACADVAARGGDARLPGLGRLSEIAATLLSDPEVDPMRRAKAVEVVAADQRPTHLPLLMKCLRAASGQMDAYEGFTLVEALLFAIKRLGGDHLLSLLVQPTASDERRLLRVQLAGQRQPVAPEPVLQALQEFGEDHAQLLLKFVELAEYPVPFAALIQAGLAHSSKWVRQAAAGSATRLGREFGLEQQFGLLSDPAPEVRLMAASSLGSIDHPKVVERLVALAESPGETREVRLNALYSLHRLKRAAELAGLATSAPPDVRRSALGLAVLLDERGQGLRRLLADLAAADAVAVAESIHFVAELARAEDLSILLETHDTLDPSGRAVFREFLGRFLHTHRGPRLDASVAALAPAHRSAIEPLLPPRDDPR